MYSYDCNAGAQSTTPTLGNTAFGQSTYGGQRGGSRVTPYTGTSDTDGGSGTNAMAKLESISAMPVYKEKSHEELRWEDYQLGDKGIFFCSFKKFQVVSALTTFSKLYRL